MFAIIFGVDIDVAVVVDAGIDFVQVRQEAQKMLVTAIEARSKEDLSAAVALATQLRLRSPQVNASTKMIL